MMKTVFLLICVLSAYANESSLTYKTIDISGFSEGNEHTEGSSSFLEESKLKITAKPTAQPTAQPTEKVEVEQFSETITQAPVRTEMREEQLPQRSYSRPEPRLSQLDKQKRRRRRLQEYNNRLLQEKIERERLSIENELGKKVQKMQLHL